MLLLAKNNEGKSYLTGLAFLMKSNMERRNDALL